MNYKLKSIKVYSSPEWMFGGKKKYRTVYDKSEVDYISTEFSFYNKKFDEEDWECDLKIMCFDVTAGGRKEICNQAEHVSVKSTENTITLYKGWGSATVGSFWKAGDYQWEAYIDNAFVTSIKFYITEVGKVSFNNNPYFDLISVKLYNGPGNNLDAGKRKYLKCFNGPKTQYIWTEVIIKNKINVPYYFEYFTNYYDKAGQLKGQAIGYKFIDKGTKDKVFNFQEGWGNNEGNSWLPGNYTCQIVFMDNLLATVPFEVSPDKEIEGVNQMNVISQVQNTQDANVVPPPVQPEVETLETVISKLDELVGLQNVKRKIKEHVQYLEFLKLRKEKGLADNEKINLNSVFTGNPGTGKTTVVKLLGKIYNKMGLLSIGHVHEVDRVALVGEFIGQTAPRTKKAIEEARGGILFIDEAYSLYREGEDAKDFGREVIEILIKEMSDGPGNIAIMVAGYPREMETFINSNPGLKSRFNYYFHFEDYSPDELMQIAAFACNKRAVNLSVDAADFIYKIIVEAYRNRNTNFGNARFVYSLIDEGKMNMGLRLMKSPDVKTLSKEQLSTIEVADVEELVETGYRKKIEIPIDEALLSDSLVELNSLIGLESIKTEINELVKLVRYYRETGKDVLNRFSLHTVFKGNPGTGKTTVARIIGRTYKSLGLLERGHIVETDREGLIAGFIGQTAIKSKQKIDEATNGVLFIDEAYGLGEGTYGGNFGNEAIEVILKNMEDMRGSLAVIVAGYPGNMDEFLKMNPGLKSRFDRTLIFEDLNADQLYRVAIQMFSKENLTPDAESENLLRLHLQYLYTHRDKFFGNARSVRQLVTMAVKKQNLRMAGLQASQRTKNAMETLIAEDIKDIVSNDPNLKATQGIGFKL